MIQTTIEKIIFAIGFAMIFGGGIGAYIINEYHLKQERKKQSVTKC